MVAYPRRGYEDRVEFAETLLLMVRQEREKED